MPTIVCSQCGAKIKVLDDAIGTHRTCPRCNELIAIVLPQSRLIPKPIEPVDPITPSRQPPKLPTNVVEAPRSSPSVTRESERKQAGIWFRIFAIFQLILFVVMLAQSESGGVINLQATLFAMGLFCGMQISACGAVMASIRWEIREREL